MNQGRRQRMGAAAIVRILTRHGFSLNSSRGSHQKWVHPVTRKMVIVPFQKGQDLPIGTMMSIIKGSGVPEHEWLK